MWGEDCMSWRWPNGIMTAAILSIIAAAPAYADCYCSIKKGSDFQECGQVIRKDDKEAVVLLKKFPNLPPALFELDKYTYCEERPRPDTPSVRAPPVVTPPPISPAVVTPPPVSPAVVTPPPVRLPSFGIAGSNTIGEELMPPLIAAFARKEKLELNREDCLGRLILTPARSGAATLPETAIDCSALGSHFGIPSLKEGLAEIAMVSRPITGEERNMMQEANEPVNEHVLALDGVVVIVARDNRITALSLDQIARVFAGEITDWSQLGQQEAGPINLYIRNPNSGTRDTFDRLVMRGRKFAFVPPDHQFSSSSELSEKVADDRHGIGFVGYPYRKPARELDIRQSCGITHRPTITTIKSEDYPLARRLFLYTARRRTALAAELVDYALSDEAQPVIENAHFINLSISAEAAADDRDRINRYGDPNSRPIEPELDFEPAVFAKLQRATKGAQRLSISFRFDYGSDALDSRAKKDLQRLTRYLDDEGRGRRALLAGFADARGPFAYNLGLSRRRAARVLDALAHNGVDRDRLTADGFGELLPVSCNSEDDSRWKNRRVEVWLLQ